MNGIRYALCVADFILAIYLKILLKTLLKMLFLCHGKNFFNSLVDKVMFSNVLYIPVRQKGEMLKSYEPLAQQAEHLTFNQGVRRSSRRWLTK